MAIKAKNLIPARATHPGDILKDELASRGISQTDFANDTDISLTHLNELIKGKRNLSPEIAIILEKTLGIEASFWMNLQTSYDLDESRIKNRTREKLASIERWKTIKDYVPVNYFKKQDVLSDNLEENENIIKSIYSANSIDDIINTLSKPSYAHFKKSNAFTESNKNVVAWVKLVEYRSKEKKVDNFSLSQIAECIEKFKALSLKNNLLENTEKLFKKYGIKFINQSKPDHAPVDGVSFWIDTNPTIGVTLRYHRIDNFIFTVMHELAHIFLHLQNQKNREFVDDMEDHKYMSENVFEKEANEFASNNLISKNDWDAFILKHFTIDENAITEFANELKLHPAIVKGRLCFEQPVYYRKRFSIPNELN